MYMAKYQKTHKCPSCNSVTDLPMNQIFWTKDNHYYAKCGVSARPCMFEIDIYNGGNYVSIHTHLTNVTRELDTVKQNIIRLRMKYIFWYGTSIGEASESQNEDFVNEFKSLIDSFEIVKSEYGQICREYFELHFPDTVKQNQIDALQKEITENYASLRESMYDLLLSVKSTGDSEENSKSLESMIQLQIDTNKLKTERDDLQYATQGVINDIISRSIGEADEDYKWITVSYMFSRLVQYNAPLEKIIINQDPDNGPRVIVFKIEEKEEEDFVYIKEIDQEVLAEEFRIRSLNGAFLPEEKAEVLRKKLQKEMIRKIRKSRRIKKQKNKEKKEIQREE